MTASQADQRRAPGGGRLRLAHDRFTRRTAALLATYLVAFGVTGYRLVAVQVLHADRYAAIGAEQRNRNIALPARRGRIYDRDGHVLATSVEAATVYADPRAFRPRQGPRGRSIPAAGDPTRTAAVLAPLLGRDAASLETRLRRNAHFVYLARQVDRATGERVRRLELPGIGVTREPRRVYPGGALAAQLLGYVGVDGDGLSGLEMQHDGLLQGRPGTLALEQAPGGLTIASAARQLTPPESGTDLVLTIDRELQHVAERAARAAAERHDAAAASVVVVEVRTGEVLAMASVPGYDPNHIEGSAPASRRNRTVTDMFEPGSVQKAVTAAAAIEERIARPDTSFAVPDHIRVSSKTFHDDHEHPTQRLQLRDIIEQSSNVGTIQLAQRLGAERLARYLRAFGYGQPLQVGFPGEAAGAVPAVDRWSRTSLPTIAIGYGVALTPLQAAAVYATIANDGLAVRPQLVRGTVGGDGRLAPAARPAARRVVSRATARLLREMLVRVVDGERGTGSRAAIPGYDVAGKTGTARKPLTDARGYSDEYVASFVGFAPAHQPRLVVAVMVDEPTPIYGGLVAAPLFREVMAFGLAHRRVAPSRPQAATAQPAVARSAAASTR